MQLGQLNKDAEWTYFWSQHFLVDTSNGLSKLDYVVMLANLHDRIKAQSDLALSQHELYIHIKNGEHFPIFL